MAFASSSWRSFFGRMRVTEDASLDGQREPEQLAALRREMLDALPAPALHADAAVCKTQARLRARIHCCADAQGLWFLRSEWLAALAGALDEAQARQRLDSLNRLFTGLLPAAMMGCAGPPARRARKRRARRAGAA